MAAGKTVASRRTRRKKVDGFDLGNSPLECKSEVVKDKRLFLSTTNGTRALRRVEAATTVITAAQVNRQAAVNFLLEKQPKVLWLLGSGWQGAYSVEDTACAGAIAQLILQNSDLPQIDLIGNDETIGAIAFTVSGAIIYSMFFVNAATDSVYYT